MQTEMIQYVVETPKIPIPFHRLLKVVALVDAEDPYHRALVEQIRAEKFEVEISDRYDRDVSEDADVGVYIASVDWFVRFSVLSQSHEEPRKPASYMPSVRNAKVTRLYALAV